jgi:hypothetical protein
MPAPRARESEAAWIVEVCLFVVRQSQTGHRNMKIERTWFEGADPSPKTEEIANGIPAFDFFPDGHIEIFIPTRPLNDGPRGYVITLTREEAGRLK